MYMHPAYAQIYQKPKGACLHKIMAKVHLVRGGGGQGMGFICLCMWSQMLPETVSEISNF